MGVQPSRCVVASSSPLTSAIHTASSCCAAGLVVQRVCRQDNSHQDIWHPASLQLCKLPEATRLKRRGCCIRKDWLHASKCYASQVQSCSQLHMIIDCQAANHTAHCCSSTSPCSPLCACPGSIVRSALHSVFVNQGSGYITFQDGVETNTSCSCRQ